MNDPVPVRVMFRKWKKGGDVIALLPEFPADRYGTFCDSYAHVGQHGGADYHGVIQQTIPATPKEYADLAAEMKRIGYKITPISRVAPQIHKRRREGKV